MRLIWEIVSALMILVGLFAVVGSLVVFAITGDVGSLAYAVLGVGVCLGFFWATP